MGPLSNKQVKFGVETLLLFVRGGITPRVFDQKTVQLIEQQGKTLLADLKAGKVKSEEASSRLSEMIREVNRLMPREYRYPSLVASMAPLNQAKGNVIAFELFLRLKKSQRKLSHEQELPLFREALLLWRDVGFKVSLEEGMKQLSTLITKANAHLPTEDKFPFPNL